VVIESDPWRSWKVVEKFQGKSVGTLNMALVGLLVLHVSEERVEAHISERTQAES